MSTLEEKKLVLCASLCEIILTTNRFVFKIALESGIITIMVIRVFH